MNFRQNIVCHTIQNDIDEARKGSIHSSHSTDTEPEVDGENSPNIFHSIKISPDSEIKLKNSVNSSVKTREKGKNVFEEFIEGIPTFEYDQRKIRRNQIMKKSKTTKSFNKIEMNNYRFLNYFDAFLNIAEHCQKNNQKFSRENCREYLKDCYIIDFSHDSFIPITSHLSQKQFNKYYRLAQREFKYF